MPPTPPRRRLLVPILAFAAALSLTRAQAAPTASLWTAYFTDNLAAQNVSPAVTPMEQALLDAIGTAQTSIDIALYDFNRRSILDALLAARARGVTVRVVADDAVVAEGGAPFFAELAATGIPVVTDAPDVTLASPDAPLASRLMHNKYLILDGRRVWSGSVNMSDTDFTLNQNNALLIDSPALAALYQHDFDQMVGGAFGTEKSPSITTTLTISGLSAELYFSPQDDPIAQLVSEVEAARSSIDFAIFFFTNDALRDALLAAHARGVAIRGLWDGLGAGDDDADDEALCAAGIPIRVETARGILHHKLMVIDAAGPAPRVVAGSLNWTETATTLNNENTLILHDAALAAAYAAEFEKMWAAFPDEMACNQAWLPLVIDERPAPPPPPLAITRIDFNPPGDDLANEQVQLMLFGPASTPPLSLAGWTLRDAATNANIYTFPPHAQITTAAPLTIWVKAGTDSATDLYWGRTQPVWNNDGDTATLLNPSGEAIDSCRYDGGDALVVC